MVLISVSLRNFCLFVIIVVVFIIVVVAIVVVVIIVVVAIVVVVVTNWKSLIRNDLKVCLTKVVTRTPERKLKDVLLNELFCLRYAVLLCYSPEK